MNTLSNPKSFSLLLAVCAAIFAGCASPASLRFIALQPDGLHSQLALADTKAEVFLRHFNVQMRNESPNKELTLADYRRKIELASDDKRSFVVISYICNKQLGYLDGPSHFNVWVNLDNNQAEVITE